MTDILSYQLDEFISDVGSLNEYVHEGILRQYQKNLLRKTFTCKTKYHLTPKVTYTHSDFIAYLLDFTQPVWVITKSIQFGFPIIEVLNLSLEKSIWKVKDKPLSNIKYDKDLDRFKLSLRKVDLESFNNNDDKAVIVQIGHPNFAHFMWNELPALRLLSQKELFKKVKVSYLNEPIKIHNAEFIKDQVHIPEIKGFTNEIVIRPGSQKIDQASLKLLKTLVEKCELKTDIDTSAFNIWITIRKDGRTCSNQSEFIEKLILAFEKNTLFTKINFIFDGFNLPDDFKDGKYDNQRAKFLARKTEVEGYIETLIQLIKTKLDDSKRIRMYSTNGFKISEALHLSKHVDYYVAHFGSIQHKVAWLYNPPGFIHGNSQSITKGSKNWLANMSDQVDKTLFIEQRFIEDIDSVRLDAKVNRNKDYKILLNNELFSQIVFDALPKG